MDGTEGYYAKWNKPLTERQIGCIYIHMRAKKVDLVEVESRMIVTTGWEGFGGGGWREID